MSDPVAPPHVAQFRQILLWPIQLVPHAQGEQVQRHWELLEQLSGGRWTEVADEFTDDPRDFSERHYKEFVTFLPYVQRFLYGEGVRGGADARRPLRVFRRSDLAQARIRFPGQDAPTLFDVAHVDLHFFYDIDVAILAMELVGRDLDLETVLNSMYRIGRAYPTHWEASGRGGHCAERVEWLSARGEVLATSDYEDRARYLAHVGRHRAPCIAAHWAFLLQPLVPDQSDEAGHPALSRDRVPADARDGLSRAGRRVAAGAERLRSAGTRHPPGRAGRVAVLGSLPARLRATPLLRPLLGGDGARLRLAGNALHLQQPRFHGDRRRQRRLRRRRAERRAVAVPPPALPARARRALPEGRAADAARPAGASR